MMSHELERDALQDFFETVSAITPLDNNISDSKIIKDTQKRLRTALRNVTERCSCAKVTWGGICEVCQGSTRELVSLRNFFYVIRNAKKHDMPPELMKDFIESTRKDLPRP